MNKHDEVREGCCWEMLILMGIRKLSEDARRFKAGFH